MARQAQQGTASRLGTETVGNGIGIKRGRAVARIALRRRAAAIPERGFCRGIGPVRRVTEHADLGFRRRFDGTGAG